MSIFNKIMKLNLFNLPWKWGTIEIDDPGEQVEFCMKRWYRGPVTFYRYTIRLSPNPKGIMVYYVFCFRDNWSIAIHTPFFDDAARKRYFKDINE